MSSPSPPALQQLHRLNRSLSGFHDQLGSILYGEEYKRCVPNLQGCDLVWLVDYLDKVLDSLDPSSTTFRKCLRELRSICGTTATLPTSYTLSPYTLNIGPNPVASGGCSDVYEGTLDGSKVCIKRVRVYFRGGPEKAAKAFCQEAVMWKRLTHPNILSLLGITIVPLQLVSNWMSNGDLPEYLKGHADADRLELLSDVAKGLCYLHSCNVIHGDLKGPNILVDDFGHARIADFGFATVTQNLDSVRSASGHHGHTVRWAAPEVLSEGTYSKEADIFSFAMVMIEIFTGAIPFVNKTSVMAMLAITQGRRLPRPVHPTFTENLWPLMQRCWDHDPHLRPEASEVLQVLLTPERPAWERLISDTLTTHERISLITAIFLDHSQANMVRRLSGDKAQAFIDMVDEMLDSLAPETRTSCVHCLYSICGSQALLPRSMEIPLCYDPTGYPLCSGGFADVWKGQYHDREVAAKVLRLYPKNDIGLVKKRFCREAVTWKALRHPNVLPLLGVTTTENRFVMVSKWMVNGNISEFVKADINTDRLGLLGDVARGLIYMHDQGIIHGNLKGASILIDNIGRARLAGFDLHTMASDESTTTSPTTLGGGTRWMSPELLAPDMFSLKESRPTKESDCYALGMVMYEVLSGQAPFSPQPNTAIVVKVMRGERPKRPQGAEGTLFTDGIWGMLELCWKPRPRERISAKAVLLGLSGDPYPLESFPNADEDVETDSDDQSITASDFRSLIPRDGNGLPVPPHGSSSCPSGSSSPTIQQDDGGFPDPPRTGNSKERRIGDRLVRGARKMFEATTGKSHTL